MTTVSTLNGQELELFRVGDYGAKGSYSAADLQGIVERYAASGETPITIGHPESDREPAFGWIKAVRFDGKTLHGTVADVHPLLDQGWNNKMYRNRSVGFSRTPQGDRYLHHVAFLGAVPPVVQGLRDAQFSNDPFEAIDFSDTKGTDMPEVDIKKTVLETLREFFSGKESTQTPVDAEAIAAAAAAKVEEKFSAQLAAEKTAREAAEAKFSDFQKQHAGSTARAKADAAIAEVKAAGAWVPAYDKLGVPEMFSALSTSTDTITFSDADSKEQKPDLLTAFSNVLKSVGKIVPADRRVQVTTAETSKALPEANGAVVDASSVAFSDMVQSRADEKKIPYTEAYKQLVSEGKKPTPGAAASGAV